ncbi:MAG: polysaccharide biosynthesis C-terminal domain-containing protein [Fibrobacteria bacterium]|nr:polysaccharide biosynthesis C-terminal domain-containing protein [Fibrobacteria bacterium]
MKMASPVLVIVLARVFGKEAFGLYVSTQLWVLTMSRLAVLGLDKGLHWYLPQNKITGRPDAEGIMESLWRAFSIASLLALLISLAAILGLQRHFSELSHLSAGLISLYIASAIPWVALHIFAGASEGNRKPQYKIFINDFTVPVSTSLIALSLHYYGIGVLSLPLGLFSANVIGALLFLFLMTRQFPKIHWWTRKKVSPVLLHYSLPLGFSEVVVSFLLRADLWMVLIFLGPANAGVYAVMITISNGIRTIRQSFNPILLPVVAGMDKQRLQTDLKPIYTYCVSMVTLIQLGIGFFIVLFPEQTLMIAGKNYISSPEVLGVLIFGNLMSGMFGLSAAVLNGIGQSKFMLKMNIVSLVVALSMNSLLIPKFGLIGAAMSTFCFQAVQAFWLNFKLLRLKLWPYQKSLFVQGSWILLILILYILVNTILPLELWQKISAFMVFVLGLVITLLAQGLLHFNLKKSSGNANTGAP